MELFLSQKVTSLRVSPVHSESHRGSEATLGKQEMPLTQKTGKMNKFYKIGNSPSLSNKIKILNMPVLRMKRAVKLL